MDTKLFDTQKQTPIQEAIGETQTCTQTTASRSYPGSVSCTIFARRSPGSANRLDNTQLIDQPRHVALRKCHIGRQLGEPSRALRSPA
ncbi:hypothetical protein R1CP_39935 (plasmid) [Rhodococcus opacus]|uniref:Uncharacterized protein n=1 Tax=Rhodococcus opacus TaxID=37919 RepID=A0A1B1KIY5_RHOOP|nr:hypothetical protein R1CP_39935 [Rhodococcus opacus]